MDTTVLCCVTVSVTTHMDAFVMMDGVELIAALVSDSFLHNKDLIVTIIECAYTLTLA